MRSSVPGCDLGKLDKRENERKSVARTSRYLTRECVSMFDGVQLAKSIVPKLAKCSPMLLMKRSPTFARKINSLPSAKRHNRFSPKIDFTTSILLLRTTSLGPRRILIRPIARFKIYSSRIKRSAIRSSSRDHAKTIRVLDRRRIPLKILDTSITKSVKDRLSSLSFKLTFNSTSKSLYNLKESVTHALCMSGSIA